MYWARYHIEYLRMWRDAVDSIAKAVKDLGIVAEVYVIGGAAEERLTVLSDIDVLICLEKSIESEEIWKLRRKIIGIAIDRYNLPWDYPIELHIHSLDECREILKLCRKYIKIL